MIDQTDIKILQLLSQDSRIKLKAISKEVALSEPSVKNRINRLIDEGILRSFTIDIDYNKLGYSIPLIIKVSELTIPHQRFIQVIENVDEFMKVYSVTGEETYIILGRAKTIISVEKLLAGLMKYGKISTSIILEEKKFQKLIDSL